MNFQMNNCHSPSYCGNICRSSFTSDGHSNSEVDTPVFQGNFKSGKSMYDTFKRPSFRPSSRSGIQSRMADHFSTVRGGRDPDGFTRKKNDEECLKCMLRISHKICESHKYIRVGGGYRHSYYYVRALLEQIQLKKEREELLCRRLKAISEGNLRTFKTFIRTASGRLIEKIIFLSEEDYTNFQNAIKRGKNPSNILKNYLTANELKNFDSYAKEEQQAIKTYIRTKSGRLIEKITYISKKQYNSKNGKEVDLNLILRKQLGLKSDESLEVWQESKLRTITTTIRTNSGRIITTQIQISEEDYLKMQNGENPDQILNKYLSKYKDSKIVEWEKDKKPGMQVVKTFIRTKSGRLIEKTILMTEEEYKEFLNSDGNSNFLKKYLNLKEGETIDGWEKAGIVYDDSDDENLIKAKAGQKIIGKDGNEYEVIIDPLTGKKYKRLIDNSDLLTYVSSDGKVITEKDIIERKKYKDGRRNSKSDSEYSYKSFVSEGGTRHVRRRKRNADGTYGDNESYHSSQDEDGKSRRRNRRRNLKHGPDSAHSYSSFVSAGGTRHVQRRKRNPDGTYGENESYHSDDSEKFKKAEKSIKNQKKILKEKNNNSSDDSVYSNVSEGGTRTQMKRKRIRDEHGNIIGYGKPVEQDDKGKQKIQKTKKKRKDHDSDSNYSYFSEVSEGGTHRRKRKEKIRDKDGKVIGYKKAEEYSSDSQERDHKNKNTLASSKKKSKKSAGMSSEGSTDSDTVREKMKNMTDEEKKIYLADRARRAEEKQQKRKEKQGEKGSDMKEIDKRKKQNSKEPLEYGKNDSNKNDSLKVKKNSAIKDGNEADDESKKENTSDKKTKKIIKADGLSKAKIEEKQGIENMVRGSIDTEHEKDSKINKKQNESEESDDGEGNYFQLGSDGKWILKPGKNQIDLKNISKEDLIKLGIDPNLSKADQLRLLKEMFGDDIEVMFNKKKIGQKHMDDYKGPININDLAKDMDLDIDSVKPEQRVKIILQRGGKELLDHMKSVIEKCMMQDFQSNDEKSSKIDFLSTYRLVNPNNLESYARFFAIEDHDDMNGIINYQGCWTALRNLKRTQVINNLTDKQMDYIMIALDINKNMDITFRMFSVISALADRMTKLDSYCRELLEISDLLDIERKLKFYRELFNMNDRTDRDPNFVKLGSIAIDLKAGGLSEEQQEFVLSKLRPNEILEISFLDFLSYIPLFISYHDNIIHNPLDSSSNKYSNTSRRRASIQRDMNPLGHRMSRNSQFYKKHNIPHTSAIRFNPHTDDNLNMKIVGKVKEKLNRYRILPNIHSPI